MYDFSFRHALDYFIPAGWSASIPGTNWTVEPRKGAFVDGTLGMTFVQLDARPDPKRDGADFVRNVPAFVAPLDVETRVLWDPPSTATPLEDREPGTSS